MDEIQVTRSDPVPQTVPTNVQRIEDEIERCMYKSNELVGEYTAILKEENRSESEIAQLAFALMGRVQARVLAKDG